MTIIAPSAYAPLLSLIGVGLTVAILVSYASMALMARLLRTLRRSALTTVLPFLVLVVVFLVVSSRIVQAAYLDVCGGPLGWLYFQCW